MSLKGIPTWAKLTGSVGLLVILILAYEWKKAKKGEVVEGDPCDPESPAYNKTVCEREASGQASNPIPNQLAGTVTSGGGGSYGISYPFLPGGAGCRDCTGNPDPGFCADCLPCCPGTEGKGVDVPAAPEPETTVPNEAPQEPVITVPPPFVIGSPIPSPGPKPPHVGPGIPLPPPSPNPPPVVAPPVPNPNPPPVVAPPVPAPTGWCGHPDAVGVGRPCDNKQGPPPAGWHWFCCNGALGRAPN